MKAKLLLFIISLLFFTPGFAQKQGPGPEMKKEFKEFKMKFIAQEIDLADNQKEKFYELYSAMMADREAVMKDAMKAKKKVEGAASATEADYKEASDALATARLKDSQIEKKYDEKFSQFLSQKQIFKMKEAEHKFRDALTKMRKGKKKNKKK